MEFDESYSDDNESSSEENKNTQERKQKEIIKTSKTEKVQSDSVESLSATEENRKTTQDKKKVMRSKVKYTHSDESDLEDSKSASVKKRKATHERQKLKTSKAKLQFDSEESQSASERERKNTAEKKQKKNAKLSKAEKVQFYVSESEGSESVKLKIIDVRSIPKQSPAEKMHLTKDKHSSSEHKKKSPETKNNVNSSKTTVFESSSEEEETKIELKQVTVLLHRLEHHKASKSLQNTRTGKKYAKHSEVEKSLSDSELEDIESQSDVIKKYASSKQPAKKVQSAGSESETPDQPTKDGKRAGKSPYKEIPSGGSESDGSESSASSGSDNPLPKHDIKNLKEGRPLLCKFCEKPFKTYGSFLRHSRTHKSFPFKCVICKIAFKVRSELIRHMKKDHPEVHPYPCEYPECDKSYPTQKMRNDHGKIHWKFTCRFCKQGFSFKRKMREHVKVRHG